MMKEKWKCLEKNWSEFFECVIPTVVQKNGSKHTYEWNEDDLVYYRDDTDEDWYCIEDIVTLKFYKALFN